MRERSKRRAPTNACTGIRSEIRHTEVFKVFVHVAGIKEPYSPDSELFNQREKQFESRQPICSSTYDFALLILRAHIAPFQGTKGVDAPQKEIFVNGNRVIESVSSM